MYNLGTAPKDTPIGHLVYSAYDYVISESLGFHVDYEKTLGQQYKEFQGSKKNELPKVEQSQLDSVIEKCEFSIKEMHRPIVKSETASSARILFGPEKDEEPFDYPLDRNTYEYIQYTSHDDKPTQVITWCQGVEAAMKAS